MKKGEFRQFTDRETGMPAWILESGEKVENYVDAWTCPTKTITLKYVPCGRTGEGKEPDIKAARACACWPDATLEQLRDKDALLARLPSLLAEMKRDIESLGFIW